MRYFSFVVILSLATVAMAQQPTAPTTSDKAKAASEQKSPGQTAMQKAAKADKYIFIHFWKDKNDKTDNAWKSLQTAAAKFADTAEVVSLRTTDPAEKELVEQYNLGKSPMPMILAIAPCGAVTKAFPGNLDEKQLAAAFVSPSESLVMKAVQTRKMAFVCVVYDVPKDGKAAIPQGVKDFQADEKYAKVTDIVMLNATDKREAGFLKELKIDTNAKKPLSVLLAPGALIGIFDDAATKEVIVAKLASAQSGSCPGGKCGPGGCGPKK